MKEKIFYITSGDQKFEEIKDLIPSDRIIENLSVECPEQQLEDTDDVALASAEFMAEKLSKPIIVDDMGLFVKSLKGFPGPYLKYVSSKIGPKGLLKLMESSEDRSAFLKVSIAFCSPGKRPVVFSSIRKGNISKTEHHGLYNFGLNSIFIPDGSDKTLAQDTCAEKIKNEPRREAFKSLIKYLRRY